MVWNPNDPQGDEAAKIRHFIVPYTRGRVYDLGAGPFKAWPHFISVDNFDEWASFGQEWAPDIRGDVTKLDWFADASADAVFSSHLLEHLDDTQAVLREWWRVIKPNGYLCLYLPHKEFYPNIGQEGANPDHLHDFVPQDIIHAMEDCVGSWDLVENLERNERQEYSFLQVYQKLKGTGRRHSWREKWEDTRKRALVIRYGGIGDMIQASSIMPALREQGYRVILQTTKTGKQVLGNDPNIDEIKQQDIDQVPQKMLEDYWKAWGQEVDRCINLSESTEGVLLGLPGRRNHAMHWGARQLLMGGVNYLEMIHAIANVPLPVKQHYYPTTEEVEWAKNERSKFPGPVFGFALMGSSPHKIWPYLSDLILYLVQEYPNAVLITLGGQAEQILEHAAAIKLIRLYEPQAQDDYQTKLSALMKRLQGHWQATRWAPRAGAYKLRQTAALLPMLDGLIGPETGLLNIAGTMDVPKLCLMSHSGSQQLIKHWKNAVAFESTGCIESPCHRLHSNMDFCHEDPNTKAAVCAAHISANSVMEWVRGIVRRSRWTEQGVPGEQAYASAGL